MPLVVEVVAVIDVGDINLVGVIPIVRPVFRPRIYHAEPVAAVLESRTSAYNEEGTTVNSESMVWPKVSAVAGVWNSIAVIATALLPAAVI